MSAAPDPAFVAWYHDEWQKMLESARVPGWDEPISWDRRAAWLLWCAKRPAPLFAFPDVVENGDGTARLLLPGLLPR